MQVSGEQRVAAPRKKVWEALNDPEVLRASIPGCQALEKETDDRFTAVVEVKIGPIGARFNGAVALQDLDPPKGYTLVGEGNAGITGSAKGKAKVTLTDDGEGTLVAYTVEAETSGRLAQLGGPIIEATAKQLAATFFSRFGEVVTGAAAQGEATTGTSKVASAAARPSVSGAAAPAPRGGILAWVLAVALAAVTGFLVGRGGETSDWAGVAIGLLMILVAGAAFEYGRRAAAPVVMLDPAALKRFLKEGAE